MVVPDISCNYVDVGGAAGTPNVMPTATAAKNVAAQRSSNLRVKKSHTEKDRDDFLENSFDYIAN